LSDEAAEKGFFLAFGVIGVSDFASRVDCRFLREIAG
jgi:hypothetical protein